MFIVCLKKNQFAVIKQIICKSNYVISTAAGIIIIPFFTAIFIVERLVSYTVYTKKEILQF